MPRRDTVISVCKRCGAVGSVKQPHCVFCGAALGTDMQVRVGRYQSVSKLNQTGKIPNEGRRKKITITSLSSLLLGILAVLMLAFRILDCGFLLAILSLILSIVTFFQRKGGGVLAALGIGLGIYTMFVNLFWFFYHFLFVF